MARDVYWTPVDEPGLEHVHVTDGAQGVDVNGWVMRVQDGAPFRLRYRIRCDEAWAVREVDLTLDGQPEKGLSLRGDGRGTWTNQEGARLPQLDGCIDVDITATPFTNTLPIRRLKLNVGEASLIHVVYFTVPEMSITIEEQQYTRVETPDGSAYEFINIDGGFTALLPTDLDGLVLDYPGLFRRVWANKD